MLDAPKKPSSSRPPRRNRHSESGVALLLVVFVIALATILVANLAHSTFLESRSLGMVQRQLQAEYMVKSLVNLSIGLLGRDTTHRFDGIQDTWGIFVDGIELPDEIRQLLQFNDPGVRVYLEISPANSRYRIDNLSLLSPSAPDAGKNRKMLNEIMINLGFDDALLEEEYREPFAGRMFNASELVGNLVDYQDQDEDSFQDNDYPGLEASVPEKYKFKNDKIARLEELLAIPGFTPNRVRAIYPYVRTYGEPFVNVNLASATVLQALHDDIDSTIAQRMVEFARGEDGPFQDLADIVKIGLGTNVNGEIGSLAKVTSEYFQIVAKIEYGGQRPYFGRARVRKKTTPNELPEFVGLELF